MAPGPVEAQVEAQVGDSELPPTSGDASALTPSSLEPNEAARFDLRVIASARAPYNSGGAATEVVGWLEVSGAYDGEPIAGVPVTARLIYWDRDGERIDDEPRVELVTGPAGDVAFQLDVPSWAEDEFDLEATASRGGAVRHVEQYITWLDRGARLLLSSDRRRYRPGQTVNLRTLALRPAGGVAAGVPLTFEIAGQGKVFEQTVTTSTFGIASVAWQIPHGQPPRGYWATVEDGAEGIGSVAIDVAPFELPDLVVDAVPERPVFLPGETVALSVTAKALTGEPVQAASIALRARGVEEVLARARTDERGEALLHVPWDDAARAELLEKSRQFHDRSFDVVAVHPTTGREVETRATVRLSRWPIHAYLSHGTGLSRGGDEGFTGPVSVFVSTSYADGRPCACGGTIRDEAREGVIASFATGTQGVVQLELSAASGQRLDQAETLRIDVRDAEGRVAETRIRWFHVEPKSVRVRAARGVLAPGDPMLLDVQTAAPGARVDVLVYGGGGFLSAHQVIAPGRVVVDHRPGMRGPVDVLAIVRGATDRSENAISDQTTVVYRHGRTLRLVPETGDREGGYRPGETAMVRWRLFDGPGPAPDPGSRPVSGSASGLVSGIQPESDPRPASTSDAVLGMVAVNRATKVMEQKHEGAFLGSDAFLGSSRLHLAQGVRVGDWTFDRLAELASDDPVSEGLDAVVALLAQQSRRIHLEDDEAAFVTGLWHDALPRARQATGPIQQALRRALRADLSADPREPAEIAALLRGQGIELDDLRDPWGTPYRVTVAPLGANRVLRIESAGLDKAFGTTDDRLVNGHHWGYFRALGPKVEAAVAAAFEDRGAFITDARQLEAALARDGVAWGQQRDPWGRPYSLRWRSERGQFRLEVITVPADQSNGSPVIVWTSRVPYGQRLAHRLREAILKEPGEEPAWPKSVAELEDWLGSLAVRPATWRDPWGKPVSVRLSEEARYSDQVILDAATEVARATPVTARSVRVSLWSAGPDGEEGTADDRRIASLIQPQWVMPDALRVTPSDPRQIRTDREGMLSIRVVDHDEDPLPGAVVVLRSIPPGGRNDQTRFVDATGLASIWLPSGVYSATITLDGFSTVEYPVIAIRVDHVTQLEAVLSAALEETITVTASSPGLATRRAVDPLSRRASRVVPVMTPRIRRDFPETLLWLPEVPFDSQGRLTVPVDLADTLTTWDIAAIASTRDGRVAVAEISLVASLPLSIEPDPPSFLTVGDRVGLPVLVQNRTDRAVQVKAEAVTGGGLRLVAESPSAVSLIDGTPGIGWTIDVAATTMIRRDVPIEAVAATPGAASAGTISLTARGGDLSDAAQRKITVRPDGWARTDVSSRLVYGAMEWQIEVPRDALPGSARLELRAYDRLEAHLREARHALARRPGACTEQTISAAFPSLLMLDVSAGGDAVADRASQNPQDRSLRARLAEAVRAVGGRGGRQGGLAFWPNGRSHVALTAYGIDFLVSAADAGQAGAAQMADRLARWLVERQDADGSWSEASAPGAPEVTAMNARLRLTASVAGVLAGLVAAGSELEHEALATSIHQALAYAIPRALQAEDPYALAAVLLAGSMLPGSALPDRVLPDLGQVEASLRSLARPTEGGLYWHLAANTPLFGRAHAGRLEMTALAVRALVARDQALRAEAVPAGSPAASFADPARDGGVAFLLAAKESDGLWASTQATVQVLRALAVSFPMDASETPPLTLSLDGQPLTVGVPGDTQPLARPTVVVSDLPLTGGAGVVGRHGLQVQAGALGRPVLVQAVLRYVVPWSSLPAPDEASTTLRFAARCGPSSARVGEVVICRVDAERVGHRGYGMLIAEVGLPPGAEVDEASLDQARGAGQGLRAYEIHPERVVLYLHPQAGGSRFDFAWRPRLAMTAKATPSVLYDAYDPASRIVLAPTKFGVTAREVTTDATTSDEGTPAGTLAGGTATGPGVT